MNKGKKKITLIDIFLILVVAMIVISLFGSKKSNEVFNNYSDKTFKLLVSSENEVLDKDLKDFIKKKKYKVDIEYADTLDIVSKINNGEKYDGLWVSNSIWLYKIDSSKAYITNSKSTSINPVIFAIKESKAKELGFVGRDIYTKDILDAINAGKLKFSMSNPTSTNSGASAYLGIISTLAGNPEVLTKEMLNDEGLKSKIISFFKGQQRTAGDEDFLEELFVNGDYEAVVSYESSIININNKLKSQNKDTLYALYPIDGVSISDSPIAYIDNQNEKKREIFNDIQGYLLSDVGQKMLAKYGRRTWYGGVNNNADKKVFNPSWGIDTTKYISPIKYPSTKVIQEALYLYQIELRKPVHVVFCLDYSGSMYGDGILELKKSMNYIFSEEAKDEYIQFSSKDKIDVLLFSNNVSNPISTIDGTKSDEILKAIENTDPNGGTAIYPAVIKALEILKDEDKDNFNSTVILMTDGEANVGSYYDLEKTYNLYKSDIPVYSITFGNASENELNKIARLTNGKIFDGKTNLVEAFKQVREYN